MTELVYTQMPDMPPSLKDGKVIEGRGRLYLANDGNHVLEQHSGGVRFSEDELLQWRNLLETRTAWLERRGSHHFFMVAPNSHSLYPDELPEWLPSAPERPIHQLMNDLREHDSYAHLLYPLEQLAEHENAYARTGSHWSELGASIACRALMDDIGKVLPVECFKEEDYEFEEVTYNGDLGAKMEPQWSSTFVKAHAKAPRAERVFDNRIKGNTGRRYVFEWEDPDAAPHCLVYGDSFARRVLPFLAESFSRLTFVHMVTLDLDLVRRLDPDAVVLIMNERFLIRVPVDAPAPTAAQIEAEKIAAGEVVPEGRQPGLRRQPPVS